MLGLFFIECLVCGIKNNIHFILPKNKLFVYINTLRLLLIYGVKSDYIKDLGIFLSF